MEKEIFDKYIDEHRSIIENIREAAHEVHEEVNQRYDKQWPYSVHLDAVAAIVMEHGADVVANERDILPLMFGAYFHDSIEDARLTYNDVTAMARRMMDDEQAHMAAEIVYALTNEKGRTRSERANDKYYEGIRSTPYAPICKMADRQANVDYSLNHKSGKNAAMRAIYAKELEHFLTSIVDSGAEDVRVTVPADMVAALKTCLG